MSPDLIIFDCDGVLIDSELLSADVMIEDLAALGLAIDRAYVRRHFLGRSFPTVARTIREELGQPLPEGFEMRYRTRLLERFETELRPTPGIEQVLEELDCSFCVATSSSPPRVARSLAISGLAPYFDERVYTASEVEHGKPAPDLFLHAAARMGARPERTVVIEDSGPGLAAAAAAGMRVILYAGGGHMVAVETPPGVARLDRWADLGTVLQQTEEAQET